MATAFSAPAPTEAYSQKTETLLARDRCGQVAAVVQQARTTGQAELSNG